MEHFEIMKWFGWYFLIGFIIPLTIVFVIQHYFSKKLSNLWGSISAIPTSIILSTCYLSIISGEFAYSSVLVILLLAILLTFHLTIKIVQRNLSSLQD